MNFPRISNAFFKRVKSNDIYLFSKRRGFTFVHFIGPLFIRTFCLVSTGICLWIHMYFSHFYIFQSRQVHLKPIWGKQTSVYDFLRLHVIDDCFFSEMPAVPDASRTTDCNHFYIATCLLKQSHQILIN